MNTQLSGDIPGSKYIGELSSDCGGRNGDEHKRYRGIGNGMNRGLEGQNVSESGHVGERQFDA